MTSALAHILVAHVVPPASDVRDPSGDVAVMLLLENFTFDGGGVDVRAVVASDAAALRDVAQQVSGGSATVEVA